MESYDFQIMQHVTKVFVHLVFNISQCRKRGLHPSVYSALTSLSGSTVYSEKQFTAMIRFMNGTVSKIVFQHSTLILCHVK